MKSWVIDPTTSQRYLLVTTAGAPATLAQDMLLLSNDLAIMQALEASASGPSLDALRNQLEATRVRIALLEVQLDMAEAA